MGFAQINIFVNAVLPCVDFKIDLERPPLCKDRFVTMLDLLICGLLCMMLGIFDISRFYYFAKIIALPLY